MEPEPVKPLKHDPRGLAMAASLVTAIVMLVGKLSAYFLTGSAALLSDAAESVVHGAATGFAAFSLWYAAKPADAEHPYGHRRIAYFSAGFEGALVMAASLAVLWSGVRGLLLGVELRNLGIGLAIASGLALVNLVLGTVLIRIGRRCNALVLVSNGKHVLSDVLTTGAAIVGVGLVKLTGVQWLDPLAALIIGIGILISGLRLVHTSYAGLMDAADPALVGQLQEALRGQVERRTIAGFHQLRCRRTDDELWIELHVLIPGDTPMSAAHQRVTTVEDAVRELFPENHVVITTHMEPADHETAHPDGHPEIRDPLA